MWAHLQGGRQAAPLAHGAAHSLCWRKPTRGHLGPTLPASPPPPTPHKKTSKRGKQPTSASGGGRSSGVLSPPRRCPGLRRCWAQSSAAGGRLRHGNGAGVGGVGWGGGGGGGGGRQGSAAGQKGVGQGRRGRGTLCKVARPSGARSVSSLAPQAGLTLWHRGGGGRRIVGRRRVARGCGRGGVGPLCPRGWGVARWRCRLCAGRGGRRLGLLCSRCCGHGCSCGGRGAARLLQSHLDLLDLKRGQWP